MSLPLTCSVNCVGNSVVSYRFLSEKITPCRSVDNLFSTVYNNLGSKMIVASCQIVKKLSPLPLALLGAIFHTWHNNIGDYIPSLS